MLEIQRSSDVTLGITPRYSSLLYVPTYVDAQEDIGDNILGFEGMHLSISTKLERVLLGQDIFAGKRRLLCNALDLKIALSDLRLSNYDITIR